MGKYFKLMEGSKPCIVTGISHIQTLRRAKKALLKLSVKIINIEHS